MEPRPGDPLARRRRIARRGRDRRVPRARPGASRRGVPGGHDRRELPTRSQVRAWRAMVEAATDAERPALVEIADLLFEYVDRVFCVCSKLCTSPPRRKADRPRRRSRPAEELLRRIAARGGAADRGSTTGRADRLPDRAGSEAVRDRDGGIVIEDELVVDNQRWTTATVVSGTFPQSLDPSIDFTTQGGEVHWLTIWARTRSRTRRARPEPRSFPRSRPPADDQQRRQTYTFTIRKG